MNKIKKLNVKIILLPILLIGLTSFSITLYNINLMEKYIQKHNEEKQIEYIEKNKEKIFNLVRFINHTIAYENGQIRNILKNTLQDRVAEAYTIADSIYESNKDRLSKEEIKKIIVRQISKIRFDGGRGYYFIYNNKTNILLSHYKKEFVGRNMNLFRDANGNIIVNSYNKLIKKDSKGFHEYEFYKPETQKEMFPKLSYIIKYEPLDLVLGIGEYLDVVKQNVQKTVLEKFSNFYLNKNNYIFIYQINNINGGENFAKMILNPNRKDLIGKNISDDYKDAKGKEFRKEFLEKIRKSGDGYVSYWYKKPNIDELKQKMSYFYHQKDWNWVIASGFYFDDLENELLKSKEKLEKYKDEQFKASIFWATVLSFFTTIISMVISFSIKERIQNYTDEILDKTEALNNAQKISNSCSWNYNIANDKLIFSDMFYEIFDLDEGKEYLSFDEFISYIYEDDKDRFIKEYRKAIELTTSVSLNYRLHINGEMKYVVGYFSNLYDEFGNAYESVGFIQDITKEHKIRQLLKEKEQMFIQQSKMASMGEMLSNIAHQWRQPLSLISSVSTGLKFNLEFDVFDKNEAMKDLDGLNKAAQYLSQTIDDFRNFFKQDKEKKSFCVDTALQKSLSLLESKFKNKDIEVIKNTDELEVFGFENEVIQVFMNILNNSNDALVELKDEERFIFCDIYESHDEIVVKIKDNAGGIPEDIIDRIFEPYFTTKHQSQGTGIGLFMSMEIIQKHMDGSLEVLNVDYEYNGQKYKGAEFKIILPKLESK